MGEIGSMVSLVERGDVLLGWDEDGRREYAFVIDLCGEFCITVDAGVDCLATLSVFVVENDSFLMGEDIFGFGIWVILILDMSCGCFGL